MHGNGTSSFKTHKNKLLKEKIEEKVNSYLLIKTGE